MTKDLPTIIIISGIVFSLSFCLFISTYYIFNPRECCASHQEEMEIPRVTFCVDSTLASTEIEITNPIEVETNRNNILFSSATPTPFGSPEVARFSNELVTILVDCEPFESECNHITIEILSSEN